MQTTESFGRGGENLLLLAQILEQEDARLQAAGKPTFDQRNHIHDCGTPACPLAHWYAFRGSTWFDCQVDEVLEDFELTTGECLELFAPQGCGDAQSAHDAAAYIRQFVAKRRGTPSRAV